MKKILVLFVLVFLVVFSGSARASLTELMAIWDFGPDAAGYTLVPQYEFVTGVPTLAAGNADYDADGGNGVAFTDAAGNLHDAGQSLHWNDVSKSGGNDAYIIITIDTTGWQDMAIRWDYMSDNTGSKRGPVRFDLDYAVGSGSWTNLLNDFAITRDDAWHTFSYDLSSLTAINNQPSVQFRINDIKEDAQKDGDYWQDNIQLTGVPEPCSIILLGLGGLALLRKRRA